MYVISEALAEEAGIHTGDGSMNVYPLPNGPYYTVACHHIEDKAYMDNIVLPLIRQIYGKTPKPRFWSQGTYGFRMRSWEIIQFKHQTLGFPLGKKERIRIPQIFRNDKKLMYAFLRGLFDTDGCVALWKRKGIFYP